MIRRRRPRPIVTWRLHLLPGARPIHPCIAPLLEQFVREHAPDVAHAETTNQVTLVHGDAAGADRACSEAGRARGWTCVQHAFQGRLYGNKAGEALNRDMIRAARPHYLMAFWHNQSDGTRDALVQVQADAQAADSQLRGVFLVQHAGQGPANFSRVDFFPRSTFGRWIIGSAPSDMTGDGALAPPIYRLMMTGWREWSAPDVWPFFRQLVSTVPALADAPLLDVELHHGAAKGADLLSAAAAAIHGWRVRRHSADWSMGPGAGPARNRTMLAAAQPHHVIGFVGATSRGTWDALKIVRTFAKEAGSPLCSVLLVVQDAQRQITTSAWTAQRFRHAILTREQPHESKEPEAAVLAPGQQLLLGFKRVAEDDLAPGPKRVREVEPLVAVAVAPEIGGEVPQAASIASLVPEGWHEAVAGEFAKPYWTKLEMFLRALYSQVEGAPPAIYPARQHLFRALEACTSPSKVRVCILAQDPYHGPGQAEGLCLSVPVGVAIPSSLDNVFAELQSDLGADQFKRPTHGHLQAWADQGVLLLNTSLTVGPGAPGSHGFLGWASFTDAIIRAVSERALHPVVFLLWGAHAKSKAALLGKRHHVLTAVHPSGRSAHMGFFGCKHFSRTNALLVADGQPPIAWQLPSA
jgi:uracil-DNA glycosylase